MLEHYIYTIIIALIKYYRKYYFHISIIHIYVFDIQREQKFEKNHHRCCQYIVAILKCSVRRMTVIIEHTKSISITIFTKKTFRLLSVTDMRVTRLLEESKEERENERVRGPLASAGRFENTSKTRIAPRSDVPHDESFASSARTLQHEKRKEKKGGHKERKGQSVVPLPQLPSFDPYLCSEVRVTRAEGRIYAACTCKRERERERMTEAPCLGWQSGDTRMQSPFARATVVSTLRFRSETLAFGSLARYTDRRSLLGG